MVRVGHHIRKKLALVGVALFVFKTAGDGNIKVVNRILIAFVKEL